MEGVSDYYFSSELYHNISDSFEYTIPWRWNLTVVLIMAVFGITANTALLLVIALNQHLRTISNILVANLAVADIIMFVFSVPFDIIQWNVITWPRGSGGKALCKLGGAVWMLSQVLCVASLTAVSIERYCSLRWNIQLKRTVLILGIVWVISVLFSVPILRYANVEYFGYDISFCYIIPPWGSFARGFVTTYAVLTYLLPVAVITCCYVGMASTLAVGVGGNTETVRARRRLVVVVLFLALSFTVCWFPVHFINIYILFVDIFYMSFEFIITMFEVGHVLVYVNSCLNPVVVFLISAMHRKPLLEFFRCRVQPQPSAQNDPYAQIQDEPSLSETDHVDIEP